MADADNFKKRIERESDENIKYATESLVKSILPVLDNLEMATDAVHSGDGGIEQLLEGVNLTHSQFIDVLKSHGVERIDVTGQPLDPMTSEAVQVQPSDDHEDGHVIREFLSGYRLKGKVIRPAKVLVASN